MRKRKFFIIVLYNCKLTNSISYISITKSLQLTNQTAYLFIYDNSKTNQSIDDVNWSVWSGINYIHDPNNSGLSIAYNTGVDYAKQLGFEWVVLLDQDTDFRYDFVEKIDLAINNNPSIYLFAPLIKLKTGVSFSPSRYRFKRSVSTKVAPGVRFLKKYVPINSGLVINVIAFENVGGYLNEIKLDFADFQFIEKFREKYKMFYVIDSEAVQDFSNDEINLEKSTFRFEIYLNDAKKCYRAGILDDVLYLLIVIRHTLALTIKFRNAIFVKLFIIYYLKINI